MRISKESQYGILFCLYLARAGRARVEDACANLGTPFPFMQQIARKLKNKIIVNSVRGPGGGYELSEDIRLIDILNAFEGNGLLDSQDRKDYATGVVEKRALEHFVSNLGLAMYPVLNRKIKAIMQEIVANEMAALNRLDIKGLEQ